MEGKPSCISKEYILSKISAVDIFEKYLGISVADKLDGRIFHNPLREDANPTCTIKSYPNGIIWFRDWSDSQGYNCFGLVQKIAHCKYFDALCLISKHFSLLSEENNELYKYILEPEKVIELYAKEEKPTLLQIKRIGWSSKHIQYWREYHLEIEDLEDDVSPIKCYWLNNNKYYPKNGLGFAYYFGEYDYKIYNPLASRKLGQIRFIHNNTKIFQGERQLKFDKPQLIITSSYKDVKVLRKIERLNNLGFECVAPMSETSLPKERLEELRKKYLNVYLYHNNDKAGVDAMLSQSAKYTLSYFHNPIGMDKDISDVSKNRGLDEATKVIKQLTNDNFIPF